MTRYLEATSNLAKSLVRMRTASSVCKKKKGGRGGTPRKKLSSDRKGKEWGGQMAGIPYPSPHGLSKEAGGDKRVWKPLIKSHIA